MDPVLIVPDPPVERHTLLIAKHPAPRVIPLLNVEDALVELILSTDACIAPVSTVEVPDTLLMIFPPVRERPWEDARPPPATLKPLLVNVEVALLVFRIDPPVRVMPLEDSRPPPATVSPEVVKVDVAEEVFRID